MGNNIQIILRIIGIALFNFANFDFKPLTVDLFRFIGLNIKSL